MGHQGRNTRRGPRRLSGFGENPQENNYQQHRDSWGGPGRGGPPPWMAGMFGWERPERGRGPRVRRGDVRSAILDVLAKASRAEEPLNGYQVIGKISELSQEAWRPSPGSVYPTIQLLQDEGLVETDESRDRKALKLTPAGVKYVEENADELARVWVPFERREGEEQAMGFGEFKSELKQAMNAVGQIMSQGSEAQRKAAVEILADTRRRLYGVLADGPDLGGDTPS